MHKQTVLMEVSMRTFFSAALQGLDNKPLHPPHCHVSGIFIVKL